MKHDNPYIHPHASKQWASDLIGKQTINCYKTIRLGEFCIHPIFLPKKVLDKWIRINESIELELYAVPLVMLVLFYITFQVHFHFKMTEISQTACRAHEDAQKITTCQEPMSLWAIKSAYAETEGGLLYLNRASECNRFILSFSRCMAAGGVCSFFTGCLKRLEYARELAYSTALWLQHIRKHLAHPQQEQMPQLGGVNQSNQMWQDYTCGNRCCHYNPKNKLLLWSLGGRVGEIVLLKLHSDAQPGEIWV